MNALTRGLAVASGGPLILGAPSLCGGVRDRAIVYPLKDRRLVPNSRIRAKHSSWREALALDPVAEGRAVIDDLPLFQIAEAQKGRRSDDLARSRFNHLGALLFEKECA
jgi:hypothetical protein